MEPDLLARQQQLQDEARKVLSRLDGVFPRLLPTGSFVSGLMVWRELDVMLLGGPSFSPRDVVALLRRAVDITGLTGFDYRDERGPRSPTGEGRDERYHVGMTLRDWQIDLSIWLHDDHANVTEWHVALAERITPDQRLAVLQIKDVWHRRPEYQGGLEIYTAVLDHGVATPAQFEEWLRLNRS